MSGRAQKGAAWQAAMPYTSSRHLRPAPHRIVAVKDWLEPRSPESQVQAALVLTGSRDVAHLPAHHPHAGLCRLTPASDRPISRSIQARDASRRCTPRHNTWPNCKSWNTQNSRGFMLCPRQLPCWQRGGRITCRKNVGEGAQHRPVSYVETNLSVVSSMLFSWAPAWDAATLSLNPHGPTPTALCRLRHQD
jgi:hypothetical protein